MHHLDNLVEPPVRAPGNKFKLLPKILPHLPEDIRLFVDMFTGTGVVAANVKAYSYLLNDNLYHLIHLLSTICATHPELFLDEVEKVVNHFGTSKTNGKAYIHLRNEFNRTGNPFLLFTLTTMSFANLIRFNQSYEFNAPIARDRHYSRKNYSPKIYEFYKRMLQNGSLNEDGSTRLWFMSRDFSRIPTKQLNEYDLVYADPPYLISTHPWKWSVKDEERLLKKLCIIHERGSRFALSNWLSAGDKENLLLKQWINDNKFRVIIVDDNNMYDNSVNKKGKRKRNNTEVLVVNYE